MSGNYRNVGTEIEYQLVKFGKIEFVLVKLHVFRNYWTVQFREISSRVKSPNFRYRAYRAHCVIGPVRVQFGWSHSSKSCSKALGIFQCRWFNYWSLSGILFILQTFTPSREMILRKGKTNGLQFVSGFYVFKNALGYYYDIYLWFVILYTLFWSNGWLHVMWLSVLYKTSYHFM